MSNNSWVLVLMSTNEYKYSWEEVRTNTHEYKCSWVLILKSIRALALVLVLKSTSYNNEYIVLLSTKVLVSNNVLISNKVIKQ